VSDEECLIWAEYTSNGQLSTQAAARNFALNGSAARESAPPAQQFGSAAYLGRSHHYVKGLRGITALMRLVPVVGIDTAPTDAQRRSGDDEYSTGAKPERREQ
jgi:hypothetical protein